MICRTTVRRFDGAQGSTLHTAIFNHAAADLRFVALAALDKGTGAYLDSALAPALAIAWVPQERVRDEASSVAEIDAALANPDQVPLLVLAAGERAVFYVSDAGSPFPAVGIKGAPMVLVVRLTDITAAAHGQLTLGWVQQETRSMHA